MAHTFNALVNYRVNGVDFAETHIIAASAARWGIPVIMVSGDNTLGEQLKPDFPELIYVAGKTSRSLNSADPRPRADVDRDLEAAARTAMQKFIAGKFRPYYLRPPFDFQLSWANTQQAGPAKRLPFVRPDGDLGVRWTSPTFIEGYELSKPVMATATDALPTLLRLLQQSPDGKKILAEWDRALWARWVDPEHTPAWLAAPPPSPPKKRFHGDN
jgi:D-aminopeptidase